MRNKDCEAASDTIAGKSWKSNFPVNSIANEMGVGGGDQLVTSVARTEVAVNILNPNILMSHLFNNNKKENSAEMIFIYQIKHLK